MLITQDVHWTRETVPPNLKALGDRLCAHFGIPASHVGTKGNSAHCSGYHRSRNFLLHSPFSDNRTYSTSEPGNSGGSGEWVCAFDISLPDSTLIPMCRRLDQAVREGRLEKVAEWYGNDDGDNRVDGYDNIKNRVSSSDPSHLWHAHVSIIRSRANENHDDIYDVLTGEDDDMDQDTPITQAPDVAIGASKGGSITRPFRWWISAAYAHIIGLEGPIKKIGDSVVAQGVQLTALTASQAALTAAQVLLLKQVKELVVLTSDIAPTAPTAADVEVLADLITARLGDSIAADVARRIGNG